MNHKIGLIVFFLLFFSLTVFAAIPAVTSDTHPEGEWSSAKFIKVKFSYSGAVSFAYVLDKESETIPSVSDSSTNFVDPSTAEINLGERLDRVWWLHVRGKNSDGWSDTKHFEIKVDQISPARPEFITTTELDNGFIIIEWGEATDTLSGIRHYNLYRSNLRFIADAGISREFRVRDAVAKLIGENLTEKTFTDEEVNEGYRYHYKVQAVDFAGNVGRESAVASARAPSFCDLDPTIDFNLEGNKLKISVVATGDFRQGHIVIISPDGTENVIVESESNVDTINAEFDFTGFVNADYDVSFDAIDDDFDQCPVNKTFIYDTTDPTIQILSPNTATTLEDQVQFEIRANDSGEGASGISEVSIFIVEGNEETLIGKAEKSGENYVFDWNTLNYDNGRFSVIARVTDRGGNSTDDSDVYTFENTFFVRINAKQKLDTAETEREKSVELLNNLTLQGADIADLDAVLANADNNLTYARDLFEKGFYYDLSSTHSTKAKNLYVSIRNGIDISSYRTALYVYNLDELDIFLNASGLDAGIINESKKRIVETQPTRKLQINKVEKGGQTFYRANVTVSLSNSGDAAVELKVLEIIPKRFIQQGTQVSSLIEFEIIQNDPIISFGPIALGPGESKDFTYSLNTNLTKEQADALITSNVMDLYISPPMPVDSFTDLSPVRLSSLLSFTSFMSSLPPIELNTTNLIIIGIAVLIVFFLLLLMALLAVFGVYFFFIKKKRRL